MHINTPHTSPLIAEPHLLQQHLLGIYNTQATGPLLIAMGGVHGNEHAGVIAVQRVLDTLHKCQAPINGVFIGVAGNLPALRAKKRFINEDLNRQWYTEKVEQSMQASKGGHVSVEAQQQQALLQLFAFCKKRFKQQYQDKKIVLLDLHTFSAHGRAYSIATKVGQSRTLAVQLHVPVILGMENVIQGTTMHYFNDLQMASFCFEAGQHDNPVSAITTEAAIWLSLYNMGCMAKQHIPDFERHEQHLRIEKGQRPSEVQFLYRHPVKASDNFVMQPGYVNFQPVQKGELLAHDKNGAITAPCTGMILMPLYQAQGEDGFFIVEVLE